MALLSAVLLCVVIAAFAGVGALDLISAIWDGAWGSKEASAATMAKTTPLLLTGLAVALAYRVNLLNIGCEGQLTLGALVAGSFAFWAQWLPPWMLLPFSVMIGAAAGAFWAYPAVWLKQHRGVHEVISTLLLNYVAIYLAEYLVLGPLGDGVSMGRTPEIPSTAMLQPIPGVGALGLTIAPFGALLLCWLLQVWLSATVWGYEVTVAGSNMAAAEASGVAAQQWQRRILLVSGALAGLAGALEVMTVHHRFYRAFSPGYGFDGITTAFLVNCAPGLLWLSSILIASLRSADKWLQLAVGVSPNAILIIQAGLLLSVTCRPTLSMGRKKRQIPAGHRE